MTRDDIRPGVAVLDKMAGETFYIQSFDPTTSFVDLGAGRPGFSHPSQIFPEHIDILLNPEWYELYE